MSKNAVKQADEKRTWLKIESEIMRIIQKGRSKHLTRFMRFMTKLGDGWFWIAVCVTGLIINLDTGMALSFALIIQIGLQPLLKKIFSRKRPYLRHKDLTNLMLPPDRFSFPSGHTMAAFSITFVFLYFFPPLFVPFVIVASLVAVSRVYLGLHYPSDILIGIVLGFVSSWLGVQISLLIYI